MARNRTNAAILIAAFLLAGSLRAQKPATTLTDGFVNAVVMAEDRPDALARHLLEVAASNADSPASELLASIVVARVDNLQDPQTLLDGMPTLPANAHGLLRYRFDLLRWQLQRRLHDTDPPGPFAGFARDVVIAGPFGDSSDQLLDLPMPPDDRLWMLGDSFPGRFGPTKARRHTRAADTYALELRRDGFEDAGSHYVLWRVRAHQDVTGFLETGYRGPLAVRVDGVEIGRRDPFEQPSPPRRLFGLRLTAGEHRIVVKTGDASRGSLSLRLLDATGNPQPAVTEIAPSDRDEDQVVEATADPRDPASFRSSLASLAGLLDSLEGPDRTRQACVVAWAANEAGDEDLAQQLLLQLLEAPPLDPELQLLLADVLRRCTSLPNEQRTARARQLESAAIEQLPSAHHAATMARVRQLSDEDRLEQALDLLNKAIEQGRAGPATFAALHSALRRARFETEQQRILPTWAAACPGDARPHLLMARRAQALSHPTAALRHAEDALATDRHNLEALRLVVRLAVETGNADRAAAMLEHIDPLERRMSEARLAVRLATTEAARKLIADISVEPDLAAGDLAQIADWALLLGDTATAVGTATRALQLEPERHRLRRLLRELDQTVHCGSDFSRFHLDGDAAIASFQPSDEESMSSTSLLVDQRIVEVLADGSTITEVHELRRANDLEGVEMMKDASSAAASTELLLLRTVAVDGSTYIPTKVENNYSMTRLAPGAFVEWRYRTLGKNQLGSTLDLESFLLASSNEPLYHTEFVLITPRTNPWQLRSRNLDVDTETVELPGDRIARRITRRNVARMPVEAAAPAAEELVPMVEFGEDAFSWPGLRHARARQRLATRPTPAIRAFAGELLAGTAAARDQLERIWSFVQNDIADGRGSDANDVLLRRQGNRYLLAVALARAAGLEVLEAACEPQRIELTETGPPLFAPEDPTPLPAALVVLPGEEPIWLFPDLPRHWPLGRIPSLRGGALAYVVTNQGAQQTRIPPTRLGAERIEATLSGSCSPQRIELGGKLTIDEWGGYRLADNLRQRTTDVRKMAARQIGQQVFEGMRVTAGDLVDLEPGGSPTQIELQITGSPPQQAGPSHWLLPLPLPASDLRDNLADRDQRELDYVIRQDVEYVYRLQLEPAEGFSFAALPAPRFIRFGPLDYQLDFQRSGNSLLVHRRLRLRPGVVTVALYPEWVRMLADIDQLEQQRLEMRSR